VHVKSLAAYAIRALIMARKKLTGQRSTLWNQVRGLAVMFGARLPKGLSPAFVGQVVRRSRFCPVPCAGSWRHVTLSRQ